MSELIPPSQPHDPSSREPIPSTFVGRIRTRMRTNYLRLAVWISAVMILAVLGAVWYGRNAFDENDLAITITAPASVKAGATVPWTMQYQNNSRTALRGIELLLEYPKEVVPWVENTMKPADRVSVKADDLAGGATAEKIFEGIPFAGRGTTLAFKAVVRYQPEGLTSVFEKTASSEFTVTDSALQLRIDVPQEVVAGQIIREEIRYISETPHAFPALEIRAEYPQEFTFVSAEPPAVSGSNTWRVALSSPQGDGVVTVRGKVQGQTNTFPTLKARLFTQHPLTKEFVQVHETQRGLTVKNAPLTIVQTVNGKASYAANFGELLEVRLAYANKADVAIPKVKISVHVEGKSADLASLRSLDGSLLRSGNEVAWDASNKPELSSLEPGESGEVTYLVALRKQPLIEGPYDKNFQMKSVAAIDSEAVPVYYEDTPIRGESVVTVPINSYVVFDARVLYRGSSIPNSGPLPPQVGQTTTYTVTWQLANQSNDIGGVKIRAALPPHIRWEGVVEPAGARITYTETTGEVVWDIGDVPAHVGVRKPALNGSFKVSFTPAPGHVGTEPDVILPSLFEAVDSFTRKALHKESPGVTTRLRHDPTVTGRDATVQP